MLFLVLFKPAGDASHKILALRDGKGVLRCGSLFQGWHGDPSITTKLSEENLCEQPERAREKIGGPADSGRIYLLAERSADEAAHAVRLPFEGGPQLR
jgi:hypothetical protein